MLTWMSSPYHSSMTTVPSMYSCQQQLASACSVRRVHLPPHHAYVNSWCGPLERGNYTLKVKLQTVARSLQLIMLISIWLAVRSSLATIPSGYSCKQPHLVAYSVRRHHLVASSSHLIMPSMWNMALQRDFVLVPPVRLWSRMESTNVPLRVSTSTGFRSSTFSDSIDPSVLSKVFACVRWSPTVKTTLHLCVLDVLLFHLCDVFVLVMRVFFQSWCDSNILSFYWKFEVCHIILP